MATDYTYAGSYGGSFVAVIDPTTYLNAALIATPSPPTFATRTPNRRWLYVVAATEEDVYKIDTTTNTIVATISLGASHAVTYCDSTDSTVYLSDPVGVMVLIDVAANTFTSLASAVPPYSRITNITHTPDQKWVCVGLSGSEYVGIIDTSTNTYSGLVHTGTSSAPQGGQVTNDGSFFYVTDANLSKAYKIDIVAQTLVHTFTLPNQAGNVYCWALDATNTNIYLFDSYGTDTYVIDIATNGMTTIAGPGVGVNRAVSVNFDLSHAYGANASSANEISFATATPTTAGSITLPTTSGTAETSPDGSRLWIASFSTFLNTGVMVVDTATQTVVGHNVSAGTDMRFVKPANPLPGPLPPGPTIQKIKVPPLFIPIKGLEATHQTYTATYFIIDWEAIERWGNAFAPTLFFPFKSEHIPPNSEQLNANWITFEVWAANKVIPLLRAHGNTYQPLYIPNKTSLKTIDVTVSFLAAQRWGNEID